MKKDYILTIAIPTYNRKKTLEKTLNSIFNQVVDDVEIIVSDNASTDGTEIYMKKISKQYPYVKYFKNDINLGSDQNFKNCMELSSGKFVLILSDDDYLLDNSINFILNVVKANENLSLIFLNSRGFYQSECKYILTNSSLNENVYISTSNKDVFLNLIGSRILFLSTTVYNRKLYNFIDNPEKFIGTSFWHTYISFEFTSFSNFNMYICGKPCVAARLIKPEINLNYSVYDVFVEKGKKLFEYAKKLGYNKNIINKVYYNMINSLVKWTIINSKIHNKKNVLKHPWKIFKYTYKKLTVWRNVYPFVILPKKLFPKKYLN